MKHLVPCPECGRHVRVSELQCPFCALPLDLANTPPPQLPRGRLSRVATLAFGATLVSSTALSACGDGTVSPAYGAPPMPVGGEFGVLGSQNSGADGGIGPVDGAAGAATAGAPPAGDARTGGTSRPGVPGGEGGTGGNSRPGAPGGEGGTGGNSRPGAPGGEGGTGAASHNMGGNGG